MNMKDPLKNQTIKLNRLNFDGKEYNIMNFAEEFTFIEIISDRRNRVASYRFNQNGKYLAVKTIKEKKNNVGAALKECNALKLLLDSPNVLKFYGACQINKLETLIITECMDCSLTDIQLIVNDSTHYPNMKIPREIEKKVSFLSCVMKNVVDGLFDCKQKRIMHRDIKPSNILLKRSKGEVKLADFGEARSIIDSYNSGFMSGVGTIPYWAPERFELNANGQASYDMRSEIWSLGIMMYEFITGELPYKSRNEKFNIIVFERQSKELESKGLDLKISELKSSIGGCDADTKNFMKECLQKLEDRPTFDKLKETEFYLKYAKEDIQNIVKEYLTHIDKAVMEFESNSPIKEEEYEDNISGGSIPISVKP